MPSFYRFAPPIPLDERFLDRARNELTEEDKKGKTPEQIEDLVKEMAIYIKQVEQEKVEIKRLQEDMASMKGGGDASRQGGDNTHWFPYYQRQMIDRLGRASSKD